MPGCPDAWTHEPSTQALGTPRKVLTQSIRVSRAPAHACLLPPTRSGWFPKPDIRGNTEQPCHLVPPRPKHCTPRMTAKGSGSRFRALPHTQCDGRETCLTATCSGVQLNAATPSGSPWTTQLLHRTPAPKLPRTLNSVQVSRTGIQEVSPRMFSGCPQVGPRSAPRDPPPAVPAAPMTQVGGATKRRPGATPISAARVACPCGASAAGVSNPRPARPRRGSSARCARGSRE